MGREEKRVAGRDLCREVVAERTTGRLAESLQGLEVEKKRRKKKKSKQQLKLLLQVGARELDVGEKKKKEQQQQRGSCGSVT
ncbi:hypothetical protein MRB53_009987 [Persea americana]|uniref:Uncharacterized protein n=1 Tax=Persea americana TaxID=3435 RepID=A0ACC2LQW7_PERAE|nr:hypothetical protein MRB53_009987 [Persea americana]